MFLLFDTETNNLPKNKTDFTECRIVQISMLMVENFTENTPETLQDFIIKRDGFSIENSFIHKITNEISDEKGIPFRDFLPILKENIEKCDTIIAHNIYFDISVLKNELKIHGQEELLQELSKKRLFCTMMETMNIVKAKNIYGKIKYPKLSELYFYTFQREMENAHNSKYDTLNLYDIVKELSKRNILLPNGEL